MVVETTEKSGVFEREEDYHVERTTKASRVFR